MPRLAFISAFRWVPRFVLLLCACLVRRRITTIATTRHPGICTMRITMGTVMWCLRAVRIRLPMLTVCRRIATRCVGMRLTAGERRRSDFICQQTLELAVGVVQA